MQGYRAGDANCRSPRQRDEGIQSEGYTLLGYRDSGLGVWDEAVQGFGMGTLGCRRRGYEAVGCRMQGMGLC